MLHDLLKNQLAQLGIVDPGAPPDADTWRRLLNTISATYATSQQPSIAHEPFQQSNDAVFIIDLDLKMVSVNQKAVDMFGYSMAELLQMPLSQLISPAEKRHSDEIVESLLRGEHIPPYERLYRRKDGSEFEGEVSSALIRAEDGSPQYLQGIVRDISERKQIENNVRQRELLYRTLVRNLPNVAVLVFDQNMSYLLAEGSWITRYGYSKETFEGKTLAEAVSAERYSFYLPSYQAALAGQTSVFETERGGYIYEVHIVPLRDDNGNIIGGMNISEDITERKQAEAARRHQEVLYRALVKNLPDMAVIMFDRDYRYLLAEGNVLDRHAHLRERFSNQSSIWEAFPPERAEFFLPIYQSALNGEPVDHAFEMDGYFYVAHFVPVRDENDQIIAAMSITEDITERKRSEDALRHSEERFRTLVENLHIGVLLQGPNAEMLLSNQAALDLLGLTESQLMGRTSFDPDWNVIHEDGSDFPGATHPVPQAIATGKPVRDVVMGVYRPSRKDRVWLLVNAEPELDVDGKVKQVICTFNDITDRKRAEDALKYERELLTALMDNFPDSIYIKDTQSRFTRVNEAQARALGAASPAAMLGKMDFDFQPRELAQQLYDGEQRIVATGEPMIDWLEPNITRSGKSRWFSTTKVPIFDAAGNVIAIAGISRDITARKLTEDALRESESRYQELFEGIDDAIFVHDLEGNILDVNEAACRSLGYTRAELLNMKTTDIDAPEYAAGFSERTTQQLSDGRLNNISGVHLTKDGRRIDIHVNSKLMSFRGQQAVLALSRDITPIKRAEDTIRFQAALVDHISDAVYSTDLNESILSWNHAAEQLYGWRADEAIGQFSGKMVGSQMRPEHRATATKQIREQGFWEGELVHTSRTGRLIQAWVSTTLFIDREGNPAGFIAVSRDITERKQAQEALRQSEEKYRKLYDAAQWQAQELSLLNRARAAVATELDLAPLVRTIVEAIGEIFGYTYVSLYLLEDDHLILYHQIGYDTPYPTIPLNKGIIGRTARLGTPVFAENVAEDPEYISAAMGITSEISVPLFDRETLVGVFNVESTEGKRLTNGDMRLLIALSEQISIAVERARLYTSLRESKEQYQNVLSSVREVIFQVDEHSKWSFLNAAWTELTGYDVSESLDQPVVNIVYPDDRDLTLRQYMPLIKGEIPFSRYETRVVHKDGSIRWIEVHARTSQSPQGKRLGLSGTLTDITERKISEQQAAELLAQSRTMEALRRFLGNVSHDLRTPLSVIRTSLYLIRRKLTDPDTAVRHLDILDAQVAHLARIVEDVVEISRLEDQIIDFEFIPVYMGNLVRDVLVSYETAASEKGLTLIHETDEGLPVIQADQMWVGRLVHNLVANAVQYTPAQGTITLRTMSREGGVLLQVQDTGIGINPEDMPYIFDRFYRADSARPADKGGTGLGLAIVRKVVDIHAGKIEVESTPGEGSTFKVWLPASR